MITNKLFKRALLGLSFTGTLLFVSCGSYQNTSYYDRDGVYGSETAPKSKTVYVETTPDNTYSKKFRAMQSEYGNSSEYFTNVDDYTSVDTVYVENERHGSWGNNAQSTVIVYNDYDYSPYYWGWRGYNRWNWGISVGWNYYGAWDPFWYGGYGSWYGYGWYPYAYGYGHPYYGYGYPYGYSYYGNYNYNRGHIAYNNGPRGGSRYGNDYGNTSGAVRNNFDNPRGSRGTSIVRGNTDTPRGSFNGTPRNNTHPRGTATIGGTSTDTPRNNTPRTVTPRSYENPRGSYSTPRTETPRSTTTPRSYESPRSSGGFGGSSGSSGGSRGGSSGGGGGSRGHR